MTKSPGSNPNIQAATQSTVQHVDQNSTFASSQAALMPDQGANPMTHNDSLIMNEMNPSLLDYEMLEFRTSKRDLNRNAVKFHLTELTRATIRYEVVYKNLVRDIRKYFSNDLNAMNIQQNRHCRPTEFSQFLKLYTKYTLGDCAQKLGMDLNVIVFNLGSIINPKTMLKLSNNNS